MIDPKKLVDGIRSVLEEVGASLPMENVIDANDLLAHDEWGLALSLICTQLYEYDVIISGDIYDKIDQLGQQMDMPPEEWTMLRELVPSP